MSEEKAVLSEIIEMLKQLPQLWDQSHELYMNKEKRNEGYLELLSVYRQARPTATLKDMKKKVDNLKTKYKAESAKVKKSMGTGAGTSQVYTPTLWYFDQMSFLEERQSSRTGRDTMEEDENQEDDDSVIIDEDDPCVTPLIEIERGGTPIANVRAGNPVHNHKRDKKSLQKKQHELLDSAAELLKKKEEDWEVSGKYLGSQLKLMTLDQRMFAKKLMSDCCYYGCSNQLTHSSYIALSNSSNTPHPEPQAQNVGSVSQPIRVSQGHLKQIIRCAQSQPTTSSRPNSPLATPRFAAIRPQQRIQTSQLPCASSVPTARLPLRFVPYENVTSSSTGSSASTSPLLAPDYPPFSKHSQTQQLSLKPVEVIFEDGDGQPVEELSENLAFTP